MDSPIHDIFDGCLVGGACGDALGAPVEFLSLSQIVRRYGGRGIVDYDVAYGRRGAITDDTQMTLFTAEGLILWAVRAGGEDISQIPEFIFQAYLRWLSTQGDVSTDRLVRQHGTCSMVDGHLTTCPQLHSRRAPGNTCISALASGRMGTIDDPINRSKGCGGVMRIAPVGLFVRPDDAFDTACRIAAITHGHPTGYLAAGCLAMVVGLVVSGLPPAAAVRETVAVLKTRPRHEECLEALTRALHAVKHAPVSAGTVATLGRGWVAEEALAIGVYCALAAESDFTAGIRLAVNHSGDSDSTGAITGHILGALCGLKNIPERFLRDLESIDVILEISADLLERSAHAAV